MNHVHVYTNKEESRAQNFYELQKNKYTNSYCLVNFPRKPLFPKIIQPLPTELFVQQPSPKTSIVNGTKKTQVLEIQNPHYSQILLCANIFIAALKVNAKEIAQPTNKIMYNSYTTTNTNRKNTTIQNKKWNTEKDSKKKK